MALDDILPAIGPEHPASDLDPGRDAAIEAMEARTSQVAAEMAADKTGHLNAARIEALVAEAQARHDRATAAADARHRETVRLNDLFEHRYGRRPEPYATETRDPAFRSEFERFVDAERAREEAVANAEVEREEAAQRVAEAAERDRERVQREADRLAAIEEQEYRRSVRQHLRGGAPGQWASIRTGDDRGIDLGRRGYAL